MADEKIFIDGMIIRRKPKAPNFVKCSLSFKCREFMDFARKYHKNGWLNVDIKLSKGGKLYAELDTFEPKKSADESWENPQTMGDQFGATDEEAEAAMAPTKDPIPF